MRAPRWPGIPAPSAPSQIVVSGTASLFGLDGTYTPSGNNSNGVPSWKSGAHHYLSRFVDTSNWQFGQCWGLGSTTDDLAAEGDTSASDYDLVMASSAAYPPAGASGWLPMGTAIGSITVSGFTGNYSTADGAYALAPELHGVGIIEPWLQLPTMALWAALFPRANTYSFISVPSGGTSPWLFYLCGAGGFTGPDAVFDGGSASLTCPDGTYTYNASEGAGDQTGATGATVVVSGTQLTVTLTET